MAFGWHPLLRAEMGVFFTLRAAYPFSSYYVPIWSPYAPFCTRELQTASMLTYVHTHALIHRCSIAVEARRLQRSFILSGNHSQGDDTPKSSEPHLSYLGAPSHATVHAGQVAQSSQCLCSIVLASSALFAAPRCSAGNPAYRYKIDCQTSFSLPLERK